MMFVILFNQCIGSDDQFVLLDIFYVLYGIVVMQGCVLVWVLVYGDDVVVQGWVVVQFMVCVMFFDWVLYVGGQLDGWIDDGFVQYLLQCIGDGFWCIQYYRGIDCSEQLFLVGE